MEKWGIELYGNPCWTCGFTGNRTPADTVAVVRAIPDHFADRLAGRTGRERHPELTWTTAGCVSHVTDNLRTWAERLAGGYLGGSFAVRGYGPDLLVSARQADETALAGARWSLRWAVVAWVLAVEAALAAGVVLEHATRGPQQAEDVARNNAHDASHHLWDVGRILAVHDR